MRFSQYACIAFAIAPTAVLAVGSLGFALGTKNPDGSCKAQSDYEADFSAISSSTSATIVRGYAASDCNCAQYILPAAKNKDFKVILGIWCVYIRIPCCFRSSALMITVFIQGGH